MQKKFQHYLKGMGLIVWECMGSSKGERERESLRGDKSEVGEMDKWEVGSSS